SCHRESKGRARGRALGDGLGGRRQGGLGPVAVGRAAAMPAPMTAVAVVASVLTFAQLGSSAAQAGVEAAEGEAAPGAAASGGPRRWPGARRLANASEAPGREADPTGAAARSSGAANALVVCLLAAPVLLCAWQCCRKAAPAVARRLGRPARGGAAAAR
ncbi:unnamed protein product, partial [Prorocentrum cordatum]